MQEILPFIRSELPDVPITVIGRAEFHLETAMEQAGLRVEGPVEDLTPYYESAEHFHWATGGQYRDGALPERHKSHRWEWAGSAVTGSYHMSECQCGAIRRYLTGSRTFAEFSAN